MLKPLAILAILLLCLATGSASPPAVVVQPQYVAPQYVPAYGVQYPDPAELAAAVKELTAELRLLREELARLKSPGPVGLTAPAPRPADGLAVAVRSCSACHSPAAATEKGGGLVLFDTAGALAPVSPRDRQRAVNRVRAGSMPPPPAVLTEIDRRALAELFQKK